MRMVQLEGTVAIDPRNHFLVVLTAEGLSKTPLDIPIFAIVEGRGRTVDGRSPEGMKILHDGRNILYTGITNIFGTPVRNASLRDVLEGLLATMPADASEEHARLRDAISAHLAELASGPRFRTASAA